MREHLESLLAGRSQLFIGIGIGLWIAAIVTFAWLAWRARKRRHAE